MSLALWINVFNFDKCIVCLRRNLSIYLSVFIKSSLVVQNIHIFIDFFLLELSIIEKGVFHSYIIMMIINFSLEFLNVLHCVI